MYMVSEHNNNCCSSSGYCRGRLSVKAFRALKKRALTLFVLILSRFSCSVVTFVTFTSNLSNFERNPKKNPKMSNKIKKI